MHERLFSHASIWRLRPTDWRAVASYLAMSYLYKRSNRFWRLLIKHHLVHAVWSPLVELTRLRHVRFRAELDESEAPNRPGTNVVTAGVRCRSRGGISTSTGVVAITGIALAPIKIGPNEYLSEILPINKVDRIVPTPAAPPLIPLTDATEPLG